MRSAAPCDREPLRWLWRCVAVTVAVTARPAVGTAACAAILAATASSATAAAAAVAAATAAAAAVTSAAAAAAESNSNEYIARRRAAIADYIAAAAAAVYADQRSRFRTAEPRCCFFPDSLTSSAYLVKIDLKSRVLE